MSKEEDYFLVHVRRYEKGDTFALTEDEIKGGVSFEDVVGESYEEEAFTQASYRCSLQGPDATEEPRELGALEDPVDLIPA